MVSDTEVDRRSFDSLEVVNSILVALGSLEVNLASSLHVLNVVVEVLETEVESGASSSLEVADGVVVAVSSLEVNVSGRLHVLDVVVEVHQQYLIHMWTTTVMFCEIWVIASQILCSLAIVARSSCSHFLL